MMSVTRHLPAVGRLLIRCGGRKGAIGIGGRRYKEGIKVLEGEGRKRSFLKKRTKRLLPGLSRTLQAAHTFELAGVFCFFSSQKKGFLASGRAGGVRRAPHPTGDAGYLGAFAGKARRAPWKSFTLMGVWPNHLDFCTSLAASGYLPSRMRPQVRLKVRFQVVPSWKLTEAR